MGPKLLKTNASPTRGHNHLNYEVVLRPVAELKPYTRNARTHSKQQIRQIARSILTLRLH